MDADVDADVDALRFDVRGAAGRGIRRSRRVFNSDAGFPTPRFHHRPQQVVVQPGRHRERVLEAARARERLQVPRPREPQGPVPPVVAKLIVGTYPRVVVLGVLYDGQIVALAPLGALAPGHQPHRTRVHQVHQLDVHPRALAQVAHLFGVEGGSASAVADRLEAAHGVLLREERDDLEAPRPPRFVLQRADDAGGERELPAFEARANGGSHGPSDVGAVEDDAGVPSRRRGGGGVFRCGGVRRVPARGSARVCAPPPQGHPPTRIFPRGPPPTAPGTCPGESPGRHRVAPAWPQSFSTVVRGAPRSSGRRGARGFAAPRATAGEVTRRMIYAAAWVDDATRTRRRPDRARWSGVRHLARGRKATKQFTRRLEFTL